MRHRLAAIIALAMIPNLADAQVMPKVNGILSFSVGTVRIDGPGAQQNAMNLVSDLVFSDGFSLGFDADVVNLLPDSAGPDITLTRVQLEPTWHLSNGVYVGGYVQRTGISAYAASLDSAGGFAGYDAGTWAFEGYLGQSRTNGTTLRAFPTLANAGATLTLRPAPNVQLFAHIDQTRADSDGFGMDMRSIGGQFDFNNGMMIYGAAQELAESNSEMLQTTTLGAGFDLSRLNSALAGMITLEQTRNTVPNAFDETITRLGWVMPIGKAKAMPLDSAARVARGGVRGAYVSAIISGAY